MWSKVFRSLAVYFELLEEKSKRIKKRRELIRKYGQCGWCGRIFEPNEPLQHVHTYNFLNFPVFYEGKVFDDG